MKSKNTVYTSVRVPYRLYLIYKELLGKDINVKKTFEHYACNKLRYKKHIRNIKYTDCKFAINIPIQLELLQEIRDKSNMSKLYRQFLDDINRELNT
jgi:hypothetical protein